MESRALQPFMIPLSMRPKSAAWDICQSFFAIFLQIDSNWVNISARMLLARQADGE